MRGRCPEHTTPVRQQDCAQATRSFLSKEFTLPVRVGSGSPAPAGTTLAPLTPRPGHTTRPPPSSEFAAAPPGCSLKVAPGFTPYYNTGQGVNGGAYRPLCEDNVIHATFKGCFALPVDGTADPANKIYDYLVEAAATNADPAPGAHNFDECKLLAVKRGAIFFAFVTMRAGSPKRADECFVFAGPGAVGVAPVVASMARLPADRCKVRHALPGRPVRLLVVER